MRLAERARAWWSRDNDSRPPMTCAYGSIPGAFENCATVLAPGEGVWDGARVFCSEDHDDRDQAERTL